MKNLNGGFSKEVTDSYRWKRYTESKHVAGYIGSSERTSKRDAIVENFLREQGLGPEGIAEWLTSTSARHLMDDPGETTAEFTERAKSYTDTAFVDVTIWNHPDHAGSLSSTMKIGKLLKAKFKKS